MTGKKHSNIVRRLIVVVLAICVIINIHFLILNPFNIIRFPAIEKKGISYYSHDKYLDFQDGDKFKIMIDNLGFVDDCRAVDFCYFNNFLNDNPYFGKYMDFYALELEAEEDIYYEVKSAAENNMHYYGVLEDFDYYDITDFTTYSELYMLSFHDATFTIRCIMITSLNDAKYRNGYVLIGTHLPEWWKSKNIE